MLWRHRAVDGMLSRMNRTAKITTVVAAAAVAGIGILAAPVFLGAATWASDTFASTPASAGVAESPLPTASAVVTPPADGAGDGPGDCASTARISTVSTRNDDGGPFFSKLSGDLVEMGASPLANGTVRTNEAGEIVAYEVAAGDSPIAIGERFCIDYITMQSHNHVRAGMIHEGDVLYLRPDPTLPWVDPYMPFDAQPGDHTGPYYDGIDFMRNAVAARDLDAARAVWAGLADDVQPDARDVASRALDAEDWELLRQMFP